MRRLTRNARVALLVDELSHNRPLGAEWTAYSEETAKELAIVRAAALAQADYGQSGDHHLQYQQDRRASRTCSKSTCCSKQAGLYYVGEDGTPSATIMSVPLFETIADLQAAPETMRAFFAIPANARARTKRAGTKR